MLNMDKKFLNKNFIMYIEKEWSSGRMDDDKFLLMCKLKKKFNIITIGDFVNLIGNLWIED